MHDRTVWIHIRAVVSSASALAVGAAETDVEVLFQILELVCEDELALLTLRLERVQYAGLRCPQRLTIRNRASDWPSDDVHECQFRHPLDTHRRVRSLRFLR